MVVDSRSCVFVTRETCVAVVFKSMVRVVVDSTVFVLVTGDKTVDVILEPSIFVIVEWMVRVVVSGNNMVAVVSEMMVEVKVRVVVVSLVVEVGSAYGGGPGVEVRHLDTKNVAVFVDT